MKNLISISFLFILLSCSNKKINENDFTCREYQLHIQDLQNKIQSLQSRTDSLKLELKKADKWIDLLENPIAK